MSIKQKAKKILLKNKHLNKLYEKKQLWKKKRDFELRYKRRDTSRLAQLKDTKKGKRCFIIGNGPSLTIEDLERIGTEDSFAMNRIYQIFNQTKWRPTYYYSQDRETLDDVSQDFQTVINECGLVILNSSAIHYFKMKDRPKKLNFAFINDRDRDVESGNRKPLFSSDITEQIYEGNTATYGCIQIAVYMGYSHIYILGVDHNYSITLNEDGTIIENNDVKNYMPGLEGRLTNLPVLDKATLAYRVAREECEKKGIGIWNATRGGKLEVFERISFDSLF